MTPAVGVGVGAAVLGLAGFLIGDEEAGPAVIGGLVGAGVGYLVARAFPDDFIAHAAAGTDPAWAEYSPSGAQKAHARLALLTIAGGAGVGLGMNPSTANGAVLNLSLPLVTGLPDANAQLGGLLKSIALANVGVINVWLESVAYSSILLASKNVKMPAPFAVLTDSVRGWA